MWINVKDFGATGNGTTDDTAFIQAAIDSAINNAAAHNVVYFPAGRYKISTTLSLYRSLGIRLVGVANSLAHELRGAPGYEGDQVESLLFWAGADNGTLLKVDGSYNAAIENLVFLGRLGSTGDRAGILLLQQSSGSGGEYPAGHGLYSDVTFRDADIGVSLDVATGFNCADNTFVHCSFLGCDTGLKCRSPQVVNNTLIRCDFTDSTIGIHHEQGGDIQVYGASMNGGTGDTFMKIEGGGNNASSFVLSGVRLESTLGTPVLLDADSAGWQANISIDQFSWSGDFYPAAWNSATTFGNGQLTRVGTTIYRSKAGSNTNNSPPNATWWDVVGTWDTTPVLTVGKGCNCTVRNSSFKSPFVALVRGATTTSPPLWSTLRFEHCRFAYDPSESITVGTGADGNAYWRTIDCTDTAGQPVPDEENWPAEYARLAGRSGGQTLNGGTAASENLSLVSTTNATKGAIILGTNVLRVGPGDVARLAQYPLQFASSTGASDDVGIKRSAAGILQITNASTGLGSVLLGSSATGNTSLTIRAIASQTAAALAVQNSSSLGLLSISKDGHVVTPAGADSDTAGVAALPLTLTGGKGGNALSSGPMTDKPGGNGADLVLTAGIGGNGSGDGVGDADAGTGGSVKLQAALPGTPAGLGAAVAGEVVVNDAGHATNFRVESDSDANCLFVDGTNSRVGINTNGPAAALDINSDVVVLRTSKTPANNAAGSVGSICWSADHLYVKTGSSQWKRVALSTY